MKRFMLPRRLLIARRKHWLVIGVLLGWLNAAQSAEAVFSHPQSAAELLKTTLQRPAAALQKAKAMRSEFVYRKFLKEIPQPLVSRGEFTTIKGVGINWHTREPFDSEFVLTATGMVQRDAGQTTLQMTGDEQPAVREVARIFLALLSLDVTSLEQSFALFGMRQNGQWQVGLRPTAPAIAAVFSRAVLHGGEQVDGIVLHDAGGDRSEIEFTAIRYADSIGAAEQRLFGR